jgi:hypothetical protein
MGERDCAVHARTSRHLVDGQRLVGLVEVEQDAAASGILNGACQPLDVALASAPAGGILAPELMGGFGVFRDLSLPGGADFGKESALLAIYRVLTVLII